MTPMADGRYLRGELKWADPVHPVWVAVESATGAEKWAWCLAETATKGLGAEERRMLAHMVRRALLAVPPRLGIPWLGAEWVAFEGGQLWWVTDAIPGAVRLDETSVTLDTLERDRWAQRLLLILEQWHAHGWIHGDVTPRAVFLDEDGRPWLGGIGVARNWLADRFDQDDPLDPTPEGHDRRRMHLPARDLYALATLLDQLHPPAGPDELSSWRSLDPAVRPATAMQARSAWALQSVPVSLPTWRHLDAIRVALQDLKFARRECPACGDVLEDPKPAKPRTCPVCLAGRWTPYQAQEGMCPQCQTGVLRHRTTSKRRPACPECDRGLLIKTKTGWKCAWCHAQPDAGTLSERVLYICEDCDQALAPAADNTWQLGPEGDAWTMREWAELAATGEMGLGNGMCPKCDARGHTENGVFTLLSPQTGSGFERGYALRAMNKEILPWVAVGQTTANPGLVCRSGDVEFDTTPQGLKLVRAETNPIAQHLGEVHDLGSWHRIARDLPTADEEDDLEELFDDALRLAYAQGELGLDGEANALCWSGRAVWVKDGQRRSGMLRITPDRIQFRGWLRRHMGLVSQLKGMDFDGERMFMMWRESEADWEFEITPIRWNLVLPSGRRKLMLTASDLARRFAVPERSRPG